MTKETELGQEETGLLQADVAYPVWSPYEAHEAAAVMLQALAKTKVNQFRLLFCEEKKV